jgi:hypothetical protein
MKNAISVDIALDQRDPHLAVKHADTIAALRKWGYHPLADSVETVVALETANRRRTHQHYLRLLDEAAGS